MGKNICADKDAMLLDNSAQKRVQSAKASLPSHTLEAPPGRGQLCPPYAPGLSPGPSWPHTQRNTHQMNHQSRTQSSQGRPASTPRGPGWSAHSAAHSTLHTHTSTTKACPASGALARSDPASCLLALPPTPVVFKHSVTSEV